VLREFGLELEEGVELRVLDSTADLRYLVIPRRPADTEAMSEEELVKLVTRDSMIGVAQPLAPAAARA
jgi:nitrile hydratase